MEPEELIDALDPCIAACIDLGIANYSATARLLATHAEQLGARLSEAAAKMRLLRWKDRERRKSCHGLTCDPLLHLLASTRVELREGVAVLSVEKASFPRLEKLIPKLMVEARLLHILQSINAITIIIDEEHLEELRTSIGEPLEELRGQAAIILVSPREILDTPGFTAYITSLLAVNNVNITQVVSCYTDTTIIVSAQDAQKTYQLITRAINLARMLTKARKQHPDKHQAPHA